LQSKHSVIGQLKSNITISVAAQTKAHILLAQHAVTFTTVSLNKVEQTIQDPKDVRLNLKSCSMSYVCKQGVQNQRSQNIRTFLALYHTGTNTRKYSDHELGTMNI
jgi:hypothetical protein